MTLHNVQNNNALISNRRTRHIWRINAAYSKILHSIMLNKLEQPYFKNWEFHLFPDIASLLRFLLPLQ